MKKSFVTLIMVIVAVSAYAQGSDDACVFSQTYYQGTAKALGMGNALGAVGGDMTAVCINPAGLGLYRSGELTMSLSLADRFEVGTYYGESRAANKLRVSIPNVGFVKTTQVSNFRPLRYTQFCIGLTRTNDYNIHSFAKGLNPTSSKIDNYLMRMDGYSPYDLQREFPYDIFPAWNTFLLDINNDGYYTSPVPQGGIIQSSEREFRGRAEEWTFGYSMNYFDRLFVGVSLGLTHIKRVGYSELAEALPEQSDIDTDFNRWSFTEDYKSSGTGVNGKIGLVWIASPWLRLGAAFHSPTIYSFDESWSTTTESQIGWVARKSLSPQSTYEYYLFTPLKWVGSAAFVFGSKGMISMDVETANFGASFFKADDYDYSGANKDIKDNYGRSYNFRLGTEWRIRDSYLRLGAGYYGSPFGLGNPNGSVKKASIGISLPLGPYTSLDLAYEISHGKQQYTQYDPGDLAIESVTQRELRHVALSTLKIKF